MTRHYIGEIGTEIIVDIGVDITGATPTKLKVKKDGAKSINNHKFLEDYVNRIAKSTKKMSVAQTQQIAARLFMEE